MFVPEHNATCPLWFLVVVFFRRDQIAEQKEYRRKKQQKKAQRLKQMEEEREQEKNKWLDFNTKVRSGIQYKHQSPKTVMLSV